MQTVTIRSAGAPFGGDSSNLVGPSTARPALGFLVADASFRPFSANHEAVKILTYPEQPSQSLVAAFDKKVRRSLLLAQGSPSSGNAVPPVIQFKSGRRTYFCRAFFLEEGLAHHASVLMVLERGMSGSIVSQVAQHFHLTQREEQAVALLLEGIGNKEMADRMRISANTVKAFLRLIMIKMGVSTRSGIVAKVLGIALSLPAAAQTSRSG